MVRLGARLLALAIALVTVGAALHLPIAAPLLRRFLPAGVCPVTRGTPEQVDRATAIAAAAIRREALTPAASRPALGFTLGATTTRDLATWASSHGVSCESIAGNATLQRCRNVPARAVGQPEFFGPLEEMTFEFRASGTLVSVATMRRGLGAADAAAISAAIADAHRERLGPPTREGGVPLAAHLGRGSMATFVAEHTFSDYRATIAATNLAKTGVMVREEYLALE